MTRLSEPPLLGFAGIDTIKLTAEIDDLAPDSFDYTGRGREDDLKNLRVRLPGGFLKVTMLKSGPSGTIQLSPPRSVRGSNLQVATMAETLAAIDEATEATNRHVDWGSDFTLSHLDISMDCLYPSQREYGEYIAGLAGLPQPRDPHQAFRAEGKDITGIHWHQPGRWRTTVYDKGAEACARIGTARSSADRARAASDARHAANRFRIECRRSRRALREAGLNTLEDLTDERLAVDHRMQSERCQLMKPVNSQEALKLILEGVAAEHKKELPRLVGTLSLRSLGLDDGQSPNTRRKMLRLADEYGISDALFGGGVHHSVVLDYDGAVLRKIPREGG